MKKIPLVEMQGITKTFPGIVANDQVDFRVYPGEIHALLGENGAGKSTLMSILAGLYQPDAGVIKVRGEIMPIHSPKDALAAGIGMIYQHFRLVDNFTVAENVFLGMYPGFKLDYKRLEQETLKLSEQHGLKIDPRVKINQLSLGEQQRVEILKTMQRGCEVVIMDEPTTVLTPSEVDDLFAGLRIMAKQGKAIVIITHKLYEVIKIADYVTVLKRGRVAGSDRIENQTEKTLTSMMIAREEDRGQAEEKGKVSLSNQEIMMAKEPSPDFTEDKTKTLNRAVLSVCGLSVKGDGERLAIKQADLEVRAGEILAIAGVAGNGQKELAEAIAGLRQVEAGDILLDGSSVLAADARQRLERGLAFVPEDRLGTGLVGALDTLENSVLRSYYTADFSGRFFLKKKKIAAYAKQLVETYNIQLASLEQPVRYMSGGNLQKLLLGREMEHNPKVLIASYPIRGLDVAAAEFVYQLYMAERAKGMGILLILEDLEDIFRLADRVAVLYDGVIQVVKEVGQTNLEEIGAYMVGG